MKGKLLDAALAEGYYRMQQSVFTSHFTCNEEGCFDVFWLRTLLPDNTQKILMHDVYKRNKRFNVELKPAEINQEIENLFQVYRQHVKIDVSPTVKDYLMGDATQNRFNSKMIEVRDGEKLISIGYFDCGTTGIMGIMNFYDPDYRKYSLGKYNMLKKMEFAVSKKMKYYYTGYIALDTACFDYKVFPAVHMLEVYLPIVNRWVAFPAKGKEILRPFCFSST